LYKSEYGFISCLKTLFIFTNNQPKILFCIIIHQKKKKKKKKKTSCILNILLHLLFLFLLTKKNVNLCICLGSTGGATLIFETELVAVNGKKSSGGEANDAEL
jgi:hypothetical protein